MADGDPRLEVDFCGLTFATPLVLLSGCVGFGEEYTRVQGFSNRDAGAICLKGTTGTQRLGNAPHRIYETPSGMLNAIGLQNVGVDRFISEKMVYLEGIGVPVIVNILGDTVDEYRLITERLRGVAGIAALEIMVVTDVCQKLIRDNRVADVQGGDHAVGRGQAAQGGKCFGQAQRFDDVGRGGAEALLAQQGGDT